MFEPKPSRVKLICGITFSPQVSLDEAIADLEGTFGIIDHRSEIIAFTHTDYYIAEMGTDLKKLLVSFDHPFNPQDLWLAKRSTIDIESIYAVGGKRRVNLDPGYVEPSKLVLASTKNFSHRIYLQQGIYAEITMTYSGGQFNKLPWTYPDYQEPAFLAFLEIVRQDAKSLE
ncbi:MAG: DUF4416 family protein [candidate division Zixibacteria bacterium]|nr:DUF4416 family protein [candidate division Zixibacteria bacterium]